ncbi:MAG: tetratricopeptide repeat protein [Chloroflexota bacterium]
MSMIKFQQLIRRRKIPLLETALVLDKNIYEPNLDIQEWIFVVDDLAEDALKVLGPISNKVEGVLNLGEWLFGPDPDGGGFKGNRRQYGDPRNSYMHEVLQRRLGIPISLSIIFIEVASRLDLQLSGIGLPGHFVVGGKIDGSSFPILLDPFNNGVRLSMQDCAALVAQTTGFSGRFEEEWLEPISSKLTIIRVLNNLRVAYMRVEDWDHSIKVIKHLQLLQPENGSHFRDEGLIHYHLGKFHQASTLLEKYLELEPNAQDIDLIKRTIGEKMTQWVRLN